VVSATRRGLLAAAGAGALLAAGCGAPDEPPPDAELLGPLVPLQLALADAYERLGGWPAEHLAPRARANAERLRELGARESGGAGSAAADPLALERRVMAACLEAVGVLRADELRVAAAELLMQAAEGESVLLARAGRDPLPSAFPDGRAA
jgi:hypothetical protein